MDWFPIKVPCKIPTQGKLTQFELTCLETCAGIMYMSFYMYMKK